LISIEQLTNPPSAGFFTLIRIGVVLHDTSHKALAIETLLEVANAKDLIKTLGTIKQALEAGELDAQIDAASNTLRSRFRGK